MKPLILLYLWHPKYQAAEKAMNKLLELSSFDANQLPSQLFKPKWYQKVGMAMSENKTLEKVIDKLT
jgi:hypothetical protein